MKKIITLFIVTVMMFSSIIQISSFAAEEKINDWPLMEKAIKYEKEKDYTSAIKYWEDIIELYSKYTTIYAYENGGHFAMKAGNYYAGEYNDNIFEPEKATKYYQIAYDSYLKFGELSGSTKNNWAFVGAKRKLDTIKTEIDLYIKKDMSSVKTLSRKLEKYEPQSGIYIGIYGEGNKSLIKDFVVDTERIEEVYGTQHASLLYYNNYGVTPFATNAAKRMKAIGGSLQIHMQPNNLDEVSDGSYLRTFAREAKASGIPIFLRFGGEMNGEWVPWGLKPEKYIEKFKLVHDIMEEDAPNVVMVWAPNFFPWDNMAEFYPGDEYVDWVGVSCYTTLSYTSETKESKLKANPIDLLTYIVKDYGERKPIMIVEGAVSTYAVEEPSIDYTEWTKNNLRRFYSYIPLVYPEIKAMYYYDASGVGGGKESYVLSDKPAVKEVYNELINSDYHLRSMDDVSPYKYELVADSIEKNTISFASYVKSYEPIISKVQYLVNGDLKATVTKLPFEFEYDFSKESGTSVTVSVKAYLSDGKLVSKKDFEVKLREPDIKVLYKNKAISFDQMPVIIEGTTMVPMRHIFETFGMEVGYEASTETITAKDADNTIILQINSDKAIVNGKEMKTTLPVKLISSRTMVPVRFISESLGITVGYEHKTRTITLD